MIENNPKIINIEPQTGISNSLKEQLKKEKKTYVAARTSKLQRGKAENILVELKNQLILRNTEEALAVVAIFFQQGGTARSCDGNMSITIFNREFKLADIRKVLKQMSCNKAERKLARTLATEIQSVSALMEIPGNLYSKIQKTDLHRTFILEEKTWLSDFQSDNEDCPVELRSLINETFKKSNDQRKKK